MKNSNYTVKHYQWLQTIKGSNTYGTLNYY